MASEMLGHVMVNAVFTPSTIKNLPDTIRYFSGLGVRQIYLSPDYSAYWNEEAISSLTRIYEDIGDLYKSYYREGNPHYISLIDNKISVILRNGYDQKDRCRMGIAEFAITPEGNVFPCERLVGSGNNDHQIGNIFQGIDPKFMLCHCAKGQQINEACLECAIRDFCMNWCGCSNYMTSGYYNRVSSFLCHSEKTILQTSFRVFRELESELGPLFYQHLVGKQC
ncbi:MAG: SPASM domain-containing protein [Draconibacterium sp.]|nr:SPASM domain-containing protein [Draconibacterium sp.]